MQKTKAPKAMRIITLILCIILAIVLIGNLTVIIKGTLNENRPPSMFGMTSMIVMSGSMSGDAPDHIEVGDLIIAKAVDPATLEVGDVITFMEKGTTTVTHRIIAINEDGTFQTQGDANESPDVNPVNHSDVIGKFWFRIPKLGDIALYAQTPAGMLVFIGVPLVLYVLLDLILRAVQKKKEDKENQSEKDKLQEELEALRARLAEGEAAPAPETVEETAAEAPAAEDNGVSL